MNINSLLYEIRGLNSEERSKYLEREDIRNIIREDIFNNATNDPWRYFDYLLNNLSITEIMKICSIKDLNDRFPSRDYRDLKYKYFAALASNNINEVINSVINNDYLFKEFMNYANEFYSLFSHIDYGAAKSIISRFRKIGKNDYKDVNMRYDFGICFNSFDKDLQKRLIKEENDRDMLIYMINNSNSKVKSDFFLNDKRALYLFKYFNVPALVNSGITFSEDIIKRQDFFDMFSEFDPINFRFYMNKLEKSCDYRIIDRFTQKYYDSIIDRYNHETGLLKEHEDILSNPELLQKLSSNLSLFEFFYENNLLAREEGKLVFTDKDKALEVLKRATGEVLNGVVIDALFKDNIYNVGMNIREMIRYNRKLGFNDRVLDEKKINFYQYVLDINNVDNNEKIELFNRLRHSNYFMIFYDDLRSIKDKAYDDIKNNLINLDNHPEYISEEKSNEFGIKVYDLRDKDYTMLVRREELHRDKMNLRRNCYSIISNENSVTYGNDDYSSILYGYSSFDNDRIFHMFESDAFSSDYDTDNKGEIKRVNRIMTAEELVKSSNLFSEIQIVNTKDEDNKYDTKRPEFIVVYDEIKDKHIEESKRLNIPIVIITEKKLGKENATGITFDEKRDTYVTDSYSAKMRK